MADTSFTDGVTVVPATWLNDINDHTYNGVSLDTISEINICDPTYGAVGDGVTDDSAAILAAIAYAKTLVAPTIRIPQGSFYVGNNTIQFDLPDNSRIVWNGKILSAASAKSAVIIGKATGNTFGLSVDGVKIQRTTTDYSGSSIGLELLNLAGCAVDIRWVFYFRYGVMPHGNDFGCVYNNISLGYVHDNRTNLILRVTDPASGGYVNENTFIGGSLNHSTTYDVVTYNGVNLEIEYNATNPPNNNRFLFLSLEDAHAASSNTVAAVISGGNNVLLHPRLERIFAPTTYELQFTANSVECGIDGNGFNILRSNINDLGTNNCYDTREGSRLSAQVTDDVTKGVLDLQSTTTTDARLLRFLDSAGNMTGFIRGSGWAELIKLSITGLGNYANDAAAQAAGIAINQFYRNGSVVQVRVT